MLHLMKISLMQSKIGEFKKRETPNKTLPNRINQWKISADQFYRASEFLWIEISKDHSERINIRNKEYLTGKFEPSPYRPWLHKPYFFMICLSIENLLKGLILHHNPDLVTDKLGDSVKSHNLTNLSKFLNISFTKDEQEFFEMSVTIIEWFGRYPIPVKSKNSIQSANFDFERIRTTYEKLFFRLSNEMKRTASLSNDYNYTFSSESNRHLF